MEEQTVPSAGFSPQPEYMSAECSNYCSAPHQSSTGSSANGPLHHQPGSMMHPCLDYSNLADSFDLSLLGDVYDDKDMATVPSPSGWAAAGLMEATPWQQVSFYAASPPEFRAFSPDCGKPNYELAPPSNNSGIVGNGNNNGTNNSGGLSPAPSSASLLEAGLAYQSALSPLSNDDVVVINGVRNNKLLRQCLEDNTFIEKYNFKPFELPITSLPNDVDANMDNGVSTAGATGVVSSPLELNQIEPVFNLAYEQIISEIQSTCRTLAISPDPVQWSVGDVQSWLCYSLTSILGINSERGGASTTNSASAVAATTIANIRALWTIDGPQLCSMSEEEFHRRDPLHGEKIFANLELLKMAQWKCATDVHQQTTQQQQQSAPVMGVGSQGSGNGVPEVNSTEQPFDLGQILLSTVAQAQFSPGGSPSGSSTSSGSSISSPMDQSPSPATFDEIKVELDDSLSQGINPAKFSNPSSVDTSSSLRNSDDDDEEEEEEEKPVGKTTKACGAKNGAHIHLWQFLKELLASGQQHGSCIRWLDQSRGVFKIEDSVRVARLWGIRKNRPAMNYDKLSRSIRQYYRKGIMRKTERSQRLVYQFCHPYGL